MTEPKEMVRNSLFTITDLTLQFSSEVFFFMKKKEKEGKTSGPRDNMKHTH